MFKWKSKFKNLFTSKPENKYQLKRSCTLLEPFCKIKFSQLYINYCGLHLWNTIVLVLRVYVLTCQRALRAYLLTYQCALRA